MKTSDSKPISVDVQTHLVNLDKGEKPPELTAYVFSSEGRFLTSAPLDEKGTAVVHINASNDNRARLLVGPKVDEKEPAFSELLRRGAQEKHLTLNVRSERLQATLTVMPDVWRSWLFGFCFVRGNLNKRILVGGQYVNYPICNATVEVYEVDPLWIIIPKLPDLVLDGLRDIIKDPRPIKIPFPIEGPVIGTGPRPEPDPAPFARAAMLQSASLEHQTFNESSAASFKELSGATELRYIAQTGSTLQFKNALINNALIIRPLLCLFYPRFVTKQLVATTHTDECGHFQTIFYKGFNHPDTPDLYFKAKQKLFGFLNVYIYAPTPVACHTWWNYVCGTEVNLYSSSPWAHTCSPCPPVIGPNGKNRWVAFMAIGAHGLNNIYGTETSSASTTTTTNIGLTVNDAPWGGMLLPRLEFSNDLEAAGVRYYQISWRQGSAGTFLPLTGQVHHYYRHDVLTPTGNLPTWSPELLGPFNVNDGTGNFIPNMFKIPFPSTAPAGVWDVPPDINEIKEHFASAKFPTQDIAPGMHYDADGNLQGADTSGKYQLQVKLFNAQGQQVDIAALGIVFAVPTDPDSFGNINTVDAATLGLVSGNAMDITLHVDNNRCYARIAAPTINAAEADPCCGVLQYQADDNVNLSFQAKHPHNFARYSFSVVRGANNVASIPSTPVSAATINYALSVDELLNTNLPAGCPLNGCPVAGFSENLYVDSMATDGWSGELGYDASHVRAFVLAQP
ncbi:MAG: hypothetical protein EOO52_03790 [Gammaproteobacteria bacterium]|nr:MAG: hypothetical protein EOO52_03790 [Gammaproteobacteria bacterium]